MTKKDFFSSCHPVVNFLYFLLVIGCSMFVMHPIFLALSLVGGMAYSFYLKGAQKVKQLALTGIFVFLLSAMINPLFTHQGVTMLWYFPNGNPLTLESIIYGVAAGVMLVSVIVWFYCFQNVMTSDKFIYLFGKLVPALSLVLSMTFRFVPRFQAQIKKISNAQKCIGRNVTNGSAYYRARHGMRILSIMTTWALENSVDTADSMNARGYGLPGRSQFSIFRFDTRDKLLTGVLLLLGAGVFSGIITKQIPFLYYPLFSVGHPTFGAVITYICYGAICFLPVILNFCEDLKWRYLISKI